MTVDSEAIFALAERERQPRRRRSRSCYGSMATAWLDERDPDVVFLARGIGRRSGSARASTSSSSPPRRGALELVERYSGCRLRKRELGEGTLRRAGDGRSSTASPSARPELHGRASPGRPGARGAAVLPRPARRARDGRRGALTRPSGPTSAPSSTSRLRTRYWNVAQAPRRPREPVDLPFAGEARIAFARSGPVGETRQALELSREPRSVLHRALEPLFAERDVEAGLP